MQEILNNRLLAALAEFIITTSWSCQCTSTQPFWNMP